MKKLFLFLPLLLVGCAYLRVTTTSYDPATGNKIEQTTARGYALFDSNNQLTKFHASSGYASNHMYAPGITIGGLNETATTTNLVNIIGAVAQGVAQGLK